MPELSTATRYGTTTGTTTASYVEAFTTRIDGRRGMQGKTAFVIRNSQAADTMFYKIDGYLIPNGTLSYPVKAETSIAAVTTITDVNTTIPFVQIVVSVKNNSNPCTYQIDYITY